MNGSRLTAAAALGLLAGLARGQVGGPVQAGDMGLGLSRATLSETAQLVRNGQLIGGWRQIQFLQSMEFDNLGGLSHNARGNMLALNFGSTSGGGGLHSLATDGTDVAQTIWLFNGTQGELTRTGGLSVSPDNTAVAVMGFDTLSLYILGYQAGNGDGTGAAITGVTEVDFVFMPGATQGTCWLDDDTILAYRPDDDFNINHTQVVAVSRDGSTVGLIADDVLVVGAASAFTDIEYNPLIAPWVICAYGSFDANRNPQTENTLTFIDPSDGSVDRQLSLSLSLNTAREIALGPDGFLYLTAFGGGTGPTVDRLNLDTNGDGQIDASDLAGLTDNSSVDYYTATGISASFSGIDVAVEEPGAACNPCDMNCDGVVNANDIQGFIGRLFNDEDPCCGSRGEPGHSGDTNGDGAVNASDIQGFIDCLFG